nr:mesaconyl-c(4)-coa hydratase [Quercus suber]
MLGDWIAIYADFDVSIYAGSLLRHVRFSLKSSTDMATIARSLRTQWLHRLPYTNRNLQNGAIRWSSSFLHLEQEMKQRKIQPIFDDLTPQQSYRLDVTLSDFLPDTNPPTLLPLPGQQLPIPHHMIYFEPTKRANQMLADGTNPDQSPGEPFVRRMWAGGRVLYNHNNPLVLDAGRGVCAEFIRSVTTKGKEGEEKLFVSIERRLAKATAEELEGLASATQGETARETLEHRVRQRLWRDQEEDFGPCSVVETRNIVFMRARSKEQAAAEIAKAKGKILKPQHTPDSTHTILPDPKLLFRFSALTFNAHAIHLDPQYARDVEQHRDLLFHGPMSFVFLVTILQQHLKKQGNEVIKAVEYRNIAPLYCNEEVKFCMTKTGEGKYEVWAQTPEGGIAVKGSVVTQ